MTLCDNSKNRIVSRLAGGREFKSLPAHLFYFSIRIKQMNYFVIIRGPLGVGKTTIAKRLAKRMKADYVSIDSYIDKIPHPKNIPLKFFIEANRLLVKKYRRKGNVIIDGNFYYKKQITDLIKRMKAPYYIFTLKAPLNVCIARDSKRKHPYGAASARAVYNLTNKINSGIIIQTENKAISQVLDEILFYMQAKRK